MTAKWLIQSKKPAESAGFIYYPNN